MSSIVSRRDHWHSAGARHSDRNRDNTAPKRWTTPMQSPRRLIGPILLCVVVSEAIAQSQSQIDTATPREARSTCTHTLRSDSADHPSHANAALQGAGESGCPDDRSSSLVAAPSSRDGQINKPPPPADSAPPATALTLICHFSSGPRAGMIGDLTGVPAAAPVPAGSICSDGAGSAGMAVIPSTNAEASFWSDASRAGGVSAGQARSTICQFMSGPKAHGWHDYAPLPPAAIGSSCHDGMSSAGIVVATGHGQSY